MTSTAETNPPNIYNRVRAVLLGEKPDRIPFIDRMELWYKSQTQAGTLPEEFRDKSLTDIHHAIGFGQQRNVFIHRTKLHGVEVVANFNGEEFFHETAPILEDFPRLYRIVPPEKPGVTTTHFITPKGTLTIRHELLPDMIASGIVAYKLEHFIKDPADYPILKYIIEHAEYVPDYDRLQHEQTLLGTAGYVVPLVQRIPFQQILIDYIGEIKLFYWLYDEPEIVQNLLDLLDEQCVSMLQSLADFSEPYVEFVDNLESQMTNPKLFKQFCLPYYQKYAEILHGQGKKMGSHTDGNLKPLLSLLAESGLDVCESFSPAPLTPCKFEDAWEAWQNGPLIWGGIPSPILEAGTPQHEFERYVENVLQIIGERPIILGVGDMVMGNNIIERVRIIADAVENRI
jgi:hypothetical protein